MEKKKVAIIGTHNSGKTVFLTSLLWHLEKFGNVEFYLNGIEIKNFRLLKESTFPLMRHKRKVAKEKEWPEKTKGIQRICCRFARSRTGWMRLFLEKSESILPKLSQYFLWPFQKLDILDFPGERIADAAIAAYDDFGQWSDHMFEYFNNNSGYNKAEYRLWQTLLQSEARNLETDTVVQAYRSTLESFIQECKLLISPSFFFSALNVEDSKHTRAQMESDASGRLCDQDADSHFAPLPEQVREANSNLADEMQNRFSQYRKNVVKPLFDTLAESHSLIILVDIPSLLQSGAQSYKDNRQIIFDLFSIIGRKKSKILPSSLKQIGRKESKIRFSSLERIIFVATKADMISQEDLDNGRLISLLEEMNIDAIDSLPDDIKDNIKIGWFQCSACSSTEYESKNTLKGVLGVDNPGKNRKKCPVSQLPDGWPDDWNPYDYQFPDWFPQAPFDSLTPPDHIGLDGIFNFAVIGKEGQS